MTPGLSFLRRLPGTGRVLRAVGVGGVPATGFFGAGWSVGTLLLLYWLETVLVTLLVSLLIVVHRARSRKAGHWNREYTVTTTRAGRTTNRTGRTTFLKTFLAVMVPFTGAHGVFVAVFVFQMFPQEIGPAARVSWDAVAEGAIAIGLFLLAGLLLDLRGIGERPFRWMERQAGRAQARMLVTHLTILFGAVAFAVFEGAFAFLAVFVGLKSLVDLGGVLPDREAKPEAGAPRALKALGRRLPKKGGKSFEDRYRDELGAEAARRQADEEVRPGPSRRGDGGLR